MLTGGNVHDSEVAIKLLSKVNQKKFWLIRLFAPNSFANIFLKRKLPPVFPTSPMLSISMIYKARNIVERFFQRIKKTHSHAL